MFRDSHQVPSVHAKPLAEGARLIETVALAAARQWRASAATLLVLAGNVGTGKSLAAAWALLDYLQATTKPNPWGQRIAADVPLWCDAPCLTRFAPWDERITELERAPIFVLDDLGQEEATPRGLATIDSLLTRRDAEGRPTIITTNVFGSVFREAYGDRIIDRLRQSGLDENGKARWWVRCEGDSLRGKVSPGGGAP